MVDLPFLELVYCLHVLLTDGVVLEVAELCSVVREIKQIYFPLMLLVEFFNVVLYVKVVSTSPYAYLESRIMRSASSLRDSPLTHFYTSPF